eukprot:2698877-Prymnesium_polylepis.1
MSRSSRSSGTSSSSSSGRSAHSAAVGVGSMPEMAALAAAHVAGRGCTPRRRSPMTTAASLSGWPSPGLRRR